MQANCYLAITKKLDLLGALVMKSCCENMRRAGAEERLVQEFAGLEARTREQYMAATAAGEGRMPVNCK